MARFPYENYAVSVWSFRRDTNYGHENGGEVPTRQQVVERIRLPLLGPRRWVIEIQHIQPHRSFVDEQRKGPK
jgi:hypothetical protein